MLKKINYLVVVIVLTAATWVYLIGDNSRLRLEGNQLKLKWEDVEQEVNVLSGEVSKMHEQMDRIEAMIDQMAISDLDTNYLNIN
tara:strand:+ start:143 stop:397 length:255 start_codon:yes stop_codon:yes gene_type:complete